MTDNPRTTGSRAAKAVWWHRGDNEPIRWWLRRVLTRKVDLSGYDNGEIDCGPAFQQLYNGKGRRR